MAARKHAQPTPAKLNPPRVPHAVARERLFAWLDAHAAWPLTWLSGAPGAGKTMLAASYLLARRRAFIWYRLDNDDNDIGQFFATLGQAVEALAGKPVPRPAFSAELSSQPQRYARSWFRSVLAKLPWPLVWVFDNFEQAALPTLPLLLAGAIDELPTGVTLLVTCRHAPTSEFAQARLAGTLAELAPGELAFNADEAGLYAQTQGLDPARMKQAAQRVGGWAAGMRLLGNDPAAAPGNGTPQALFDYLAGLLLDRLDAAEQQLLLIAALLPWVPVKLVSRLLRRDGASGGSPALPGTLTPTGSGLGAARPWGHAQDLDARALLERLCAQHLFVERVEVDSEVYRFHPLLRDFLVVRGRQVWPTAQRRRLLCEAAQAFAAEQLPDVELDLLFDAEEFDAAATCLTALLEGRLGLGRLDQLAAWFARLPPPLLDRQPALRYGLARLCFLREDRAALDHYAHACSAYGALGDCAGCARPRDRASGFSIHPGSRIEDRKPGGGDQAERDRYIQSSGPGPFTGRDPCVLQCA